MTRSIHIVKCLHLFHLCFQARFLCQHLKFLLMQYLTHFRDLRMKSKFILLFFSLCPDFMYKFAFFYLLPLLISFLETPIISKCIINLRLKWAFDFIFGFDWDSFHFLFFVPFPAAVLHQFLILGVKLFLRQTCVVVIVTYDFWREITLWHLFCRSLKIYLAS